MTPCAVVAQLRCRRCKKPQTRLPMYMLIAITETRKRVAILCLLSFLALC